MRSPVHRAPAQQQRGTCSAAAWHLVSESVNTWSPSRESISPFPLDPRLHLTPVAALHSVRVGPVALVQPSLSGASLACPWHNFAVAGSRPPPADFRNRTGMQSLGTASGASAVTVPDSGDRDWDSFH